MQHRCKLGDAENIDDDEEDLFENDEDENDDEVNCFFQVVILCIFYNNIKQLNDTIFRTKILLPNQSIFYFKLRLLEHELGRGSVS